MHHIIILSLWYIKKERKGKKKKPEKLKRRNKIQQKTHPVSKSLVIADGLSNNQPETQIRRLQSKKRVRLFGVKD